MEVPVVLETMTTVAFVGLMGAAMVSDVRTERIPNVLILAGLVLGLALRGLGGWDLLFLSVAGAAVALLVTVPLFALGAIGGGDAKLFAVVGAFMGPKGFAAALLASAVVGGVLAIVVTLRRGVLLAVLLSCRDLLLRALTLGRFGERLTLASPGAITIPYGVAIAVGSIAVWFI
jgi:prepilin peptidase CpaA